MQKTKPTEKILKEGKATIIKPSQHEVLATIFKSLPAGGKSTEEITTEVHKKCGGSEGNIKKMTNKYGHFAVTLGVIKKNDGKFFKS
jgi:hypothetical protein